MDPNSEVTSEKLEKPQKHALRLTLAARLGEDPEASRRTGASSSSRAHRCPQGTNRRVVAAATGALPVRHLYPGAWLLLSQYFKSYPTDSLINLVYGLL